MKHKLLFGLSCIALLFAGCTTDINEVDNVVNFGTPQIQISGSINQTYTTRVDDGGFCDGDQIGLFGVNYTAENTVAGELLDAGNQVDNARYTFDEAAWQWKSATPVYYKNAQTNIDLYAYYPYGSVESVKAYKFEVVQDQSGANAIDGYGQSDFLWGKTENITPSDSKVKIRFNHLLSCANVVLAEGQGFEKGEFDALEKTVLVMNTTRTADIDLSTGEVTATGKPESEGIVMKSNAEGFRAIVVPQNVEAATALFSITVDGISYRFKMDKLITYEAGKQNKFTITLNKKKHSGDYELVLTDTEIIDWIADLDSNGGEARQYYVVHQGEPGTLSAKLREAKKNPNKIKNLKVSGKIDGVDFQFMRDSMNSLQSINLKEANIIGSYGIKCHFQWDGEWIGTYQYFSISTKNVYDALKERYPDTHITYDTDIIEFNDDEIPNAAFVGKEYLVNFVFPERVTKIGESAFQGCSMLSGALIIPDDVKEIGDYAFDWCGNITSLYLPSKLEIIGSSAFGCCRSLSGNLNLPSTVYYIGGEAFLECSNLTGILQLPDGLTNIGGGAFRYCHGFNGSLTIPLGVSVLEDETFWGCAGLNGQLILHDNIQSIGEGAFYNCRFQGELALPSNLKTIPRFCFEWNEFSSIAAFPNNLISIGEAAFGSCWRLSGVLELPNELVSLGERSFAGCSALEGIVLPAELTTIKTDAFSGCHYLNKIVCKATEPPYLQSAVFNGVAKDNFTVEVPETAVTRYQSASGWSEFKRIGPYYDFTISRRQMRVLNAEHSREFVLRAPANFAWSVESCPEWVTVTPSSGVGKVKVIVTVNEMTAANVGTFEINTGSYNSPHYETHAGRSGEIVFLLNDKDARVRMAVEQYDYEYGDGDIIVNQTATKGDGVNLVFMGDCFDARDIAMGSYLDGINEAIEHFFAVEPYTTYRDYFNVYTVFGMSNDSGMGTVNTIRDAKFGSQYTLNAGVSPDATTCFEYAMKSPTVEDNNINKSLVVLVENTTDYGGVCYMWGDGSAIAICPMSADAYPYDFRGIVQHEAGGHGFAKLGDEYIYCNAFISACPKCGDAAYKAVVSAHSLGWYRNLALTGDMDEVAWSHLIFHPKYSNIVDIYEGGYMHSRGCFRSEPNSCMNNNIPYFSAISRQEAVERIMRYAGEQFDINDFYAKDVLDMQGNNTGSTRAEVMQTAITLTGAGKQMPPKFMGDKPQLNKSNK